MPEALAPLLCRGQKAPVSDPGPYMVFGKFCSLLCLGVWNNVLTLLGKDAIDTVELIFFFPIN